MQAEGFSQCGKLNAGRRFQSVW